MIVIRNNIIPFKGLSALNLFGVLFVRNGATITERTMRHERIHTAQMRELLYVFFYPLYIAEWLVRLCMKGNAYHNISFEREAYAHDSDVHYLTSRKRWAWAKQ